LNKIKILFNLGEGKTTNNLPQAVYSPFLTDGPVDSRPAAKQRIPADFVILLDWWFVL